MVRMVRTASVLLLAVSSLAVGCGKGPVPVEDGSAGSGSTPGVLPEGHPPLDGGTAPMASAQGEDVRFAGVVRLQGELATRSEGYVFVSIKPAGVRMPSYSRKYSLADASPAEDGERVLPFELDRSNLMGGLVPGDLVLEARFDPDGFVESREGVVVATTSAAPNDTSLEIVLAPGS